MINPEISIVATEKHRRQFFAVDFINSLGIIRGNCRLPREIHRAGAPIEDTLVNMFNLLPDLTSEISADDIDRS